MSGKRPINEILQESPNQETESERNLVKEIERKPNQNNNWVTDTETLDFLREITLQLESLREKKVKISIIRSRVAIINDWEKY